MSKNPFFWKIVLVLAILGLALYSAYPPYDPDGPEGPREGKIKLGLDLRGGMYIELKANFPEDTSLREKKVKLAKATEIIRNRVDRLGLSEPRVEAQGEDKIVVQLPGIEDPERARRLIGRTALLEFKLVAAEEVRDRVIADIEKVKPLDEILHYQSWATEEEVPVRDIKILPGDVQPLLAILADDEVQKLIPPQCQFLLGNEETGAEGGQYRRLYLLKKKVEIKGEVIKGASVEPDQFFRNQVRLDLDGAGNRILSRLTGEAEKECRDDKIVSRLAIVLDDVVYSAPLMKVRIDDSPVITGQFRREEAEDLSNVLTSGNLPISLWKGEGKEDYQEQMVSPTLGRDSIRAGIRAIIVGAILVVAFMAGYYLLAGLIANFALLLNLVIIMGVLAYPPLKAVLTLPGIAALLLTVGMAVDANVLIFERIREELASGKRLRTAIAAGYDKAFLTILDANLTTLIVALILYWKGTGPIRGFGITLSVGILTSMFTALFVTRLVFNLMTLNKRFEKLSFLQLIKKPRFDFIGRRKTAYLVSALLILAGLFSFGFRGAKNFGIDFTGGSVQQFEFKEKVPLGKIREALVGVGLADATIQSVRQPYQKEQIFIRTSSGDPEKIAGILRDTFGEEILVEKGRSDVGPSVGGDLKKKAIVSLLLALLAICVYISFRFEFKFALAAIIALFHDCFICLGFLTLAGGEISLAVVAALLTVVGYSINDTIVVFDRIREDVRMMPRMHLPKIINTALNQTLSRTLLTSLTTFMVVIALYFLGGKAINDFAFVLLIGIITGTYSSVFIASPILLDWKKREII